MLRGSRNGRSSQPPSSQTPRRTTRSQMSSASESSAGEDPFIPSSLPEMSTPTANRRQNRSQRATDRTPYRAQPTPVPTQPRRQTKRRIQDVQEEDGIEENDEQTPRARPIASQGGFARDRRASIHKAPISTRSDRSGTHRSRLSEITAPNRHSSPVVLARRRMQVRQSLGPHQAVVEMSLAKRADMVAGVAGDCIVKLLKWSAGPDEQARAQDAYRTLHSMSLYPAQTCCFSRLTYR